jgi:hypothetical protein
MQKDKHPKSTTSNLGIVFLLGNKLLIDCAPVSEEKIYGDFSIRKRGRDTFWEMLKQSNRVGLIQESQLHGV